MIGWFSAVAPVLAAFISGGFAWWTKRAVHGVVEPIQHELQPNSGRTLRDAVDAIAGGLVELTVKVDSIEERAKRNEVQLARNSDRLSSLERR